MAKLPEDTRATTVKEIWRKWKDARSAWDTQAREDIDFYLGNHFTADEVSQLEERWKKYPEKDWEHECPKTPNTLIGVKTRFKSHPNKVDCISDKQTSKVD